MILCLYIEVDDKINPNNLHKVIPFPFYDCTENDRIIEEFNTLFDIETYCEGK